MAFWYDEVFEDRTRYGVKVERVLFSGASEYQKIEILETAQFGPILVLDGVFMTGEGEEHFYHEMLVQPAMTTAPRIARVLLVGGGDGGAVREILRHPEVERLTVVELDGMVVEACRTHMPSVASAWGDPRVELVIGDGVVFVGDREPGIFDVIVVDGCDPVGWSAGLYGEPFFRACARCLAADGVLAAQTASPILQREVFLATQRVLGGVFARVAPCFGPAPLYASGQWSWTLASRDHDHTAVDERRAARIEAVSRYWNREIHRAAFALPSDLKRLLG